MTFQPETFLATARKLLSKPSNEADHRTVAGRAYYSAYGVLRDKLCVAKGKTPMEMFKRRGRHSDLARCVSMAKPFDQVAAPYNRLMLRRNRSDYTYSQAVTWAHAKQAIDDAEWVVGKLKGFDGADYKSFPLAPVP